MTKQTLGVEFFNENEELLSSYGNTNDWLWEFSHFDKNIQSIWKGFLLMVNVIEQNIWKKIAEMIEMAFILLPLSLFPQCLLNFLLERDGLIQAAVDFILLQDTIRVMFFEFLNYNWHNLYKSIYI
jgi:hypothetical protein